MSQTIDQRVVEMQFNNTQFESNVKESMSTLEKLKDSLNFDGATKGLETIGSAAETISAKFSAFEVVAITAIANITNTAINAGSQIIKSLTIDQVTSGWEKYAEKTSAVQTIMAATGLTIDEVNAQLEKLNWFTDETSYNFTDMVNNIGKFTSQGQSLEASVTAMEGIATWAALSGGNVNEASRAMYNLSQAMGVGAVKLQDWKSIENANMATQEFKNTAIETALELGTLEGDFDNCGVTAANFSSTLSDGWFTADVLMATLEKYGSFANELNESCDEAGVTASQMLGYLTDYKNGVVDLDDISKETGLSAKELSDIFVELGDDTYALGEKSFRAAQEAKTFQEAIDATKDAVSTGWMTTFELIFGNYEEAKVLWTDLANSMWDVFASGAEKRNELLAEWADLGGRDVLIEAFWDAWEGIASIIEPIKAGFKDVFPDATAEQLYSITLKLKEFAENLKLSDETSENLQNTFKGLFSLLDIGLEAFKAIAGGVLELINYISPAALGVLDLTGNFGNLISGIDESIKETGLFNNIIGIAVEFIKNIIDVVKEFASKIKEKLEYGSFESFHDILGSLSDKMSSVGDIAGAFKDKVCDALSAIGNKLSELKFAETLSSLWSVITTVAAGIVKAVGTLVSGISSHFGELNFDSLTEFVSLIVGTGIGVSLIDLIKSLADPIKDVGDLFDSFKDILEGATDVLDAVRGSLEAYQNNLKADTLLKIAAAVGVLAAALVVLADIDSESINQSLGAITVLMVELIGAMAAFEKITDSGDGLMGSIKNLMDSFADAKKATTMIAIAGAIVILAAAVNELAGLDAESITKGVVAIGALMTELSLFVNNTSFSGKAAGISVSMVAIAAAMNLLADACGEFGSLSWEEITKGLVSVGALLAEIAVFLQLIDSTSGLVSTGVALIAIAEGMNILADAVASFGAMSWETLVTGLTGMGAALIEVAAAVKLMDGSNLIVTGIRLIAVGAALGIIADVMVQIGSMSLEEIGKSLVTFGVALAELAVGLNVMNGTLAASAALLVASEALNVLASALAALGALTISEIVTALVTIASTFAVLGATAAVLSPLTPVIIALTAALTLFGVACLSVGTGVLAFSTALSALAVSGAAGSAALVVIVENLLDLIPTLIEKVGEGVVSFATVISEGMPAIMEAVTAVAEGLIQVMPDVTTNLVTAVLELLVTLLNTLVDYVPQIITAGTQLITGFLQGIADNIGAVIESAVNVIVNFIEGIASKVDDVIQAGFDLILSFLNGLADAIRENMPLVIEAITDLAGAIVEGLIDGLLGGISSIAETVTSIGDTIVDGLKDILGIHSPSKVMEEIGENTTEGFSNGVSENSEVLTTQMDVLATDMLEAFGTNLIDNSNSIISEFITNCLTLLTSSSEEFNSAGNEIATQIINGINSQTENSTLSMSTLIQTLLDTINSQQENYNLAGVTLMTQVIGGIDSQTALATETVSTLIQTCLTKINSYQTPLYYNAGVNLMVKVISGIQSKSSTAVSTVSTIIQSCLTKIDSYQTKYQTSGSTLFTKVIEGFESQSSNTVNKATSIMSKTVSAMNEYESKFYNVGKNLALGVAEGIEDYSGVIVRAAVNAAMEAYEAACEALEIESPSKKTAEVGKYFDLGMASGMKTYSTVVANAASDVASGAQNGLSSAMSKISSLIQNGINTEPVIRPVLDLSDIEANASRLNAVMSTAHAYGISASFDSNLSDTYENANSGTGSTTFTFNQYNTSPKALSRTEIYRQTKNQFSTFERTVTI